MAGTRLALASIFVCQSILLAIFAIFLGNESPSYNDHNIIGNKVESLFVNRRGVNLLDSSLLHKIEELHLRIDAVEFKVSFRMSLLDDYNRDYKNDKAVQKRLAELLESSLNSKLDDDLTVHVFAADSKDWTKMSCDDAQIQFLKEEQSVTIDPRVEEGGGYYDVIVGRNCADDLPAGVDAKLDVSDGGNMFLSLRRDLQDEEIFRVLTDSVAEFLADDFLMPLVGTSKEASSINKPFWLESTSTVQVMVSLVDEDPGSYYLNEHSANNRTDKGYDEINDVFSLSAREHHELLAQITSSTTQKSISQIFTDRVKFLLNDVNLQRQSMPYRGQSFSSQAKMINEGQNHEYVVEANKAKKAFLTSDDLVSLTRHHNNYWTASTESDDSSSLTWNLVLFVPSKNMLPLKIQSHETTVSTSPFYGTAFTLPDRFTVVSIVNLFDSDTSASSIGVEEGNKKDISSYYHKAVTSSLFYFGTFIRQKLGLKPQQPHQNSPSKFIGNSKTSNSVIILNHLDTSYGITKWELDALQRLVWKGKSMDVLDRVKNILSVVELKTRIAFPRKSAEKLISCVQRLLDGVDLADSNQDINRSIHAINSAQKIAKTLSEDGDMMDQSFFALEQIFAVFGSLLVPLVLPFLLGLVREWKRYKKLVASKAT